VSTVTDKKAACIDAMVVQVIYFFKEYCWINSYAIADNTCYLRVKNARRYKMQPELAIGVNYSVTSIIPSGEASYYVCLLS
jgi:hypothetical protein